MVNILDVDISDLMTKRPSDSWKWIYNLQAELNEKFGAFKPLDINTKEGQAQFKEILFALVEELFEAANVLKNRKWAKTEYPVDLNHLYDELADAFGFMITLFQCIGLTADQVIELYLRKYKVNLFRLQSNY